MKKNIIIVDNYYNNPDELRQFILTQNFQVQGNYPGLRTKSFARQTDKEYLEKIIGKKISWFNMDKNSKNYNGSFQYTTKDMKSWVHRDPTDWAGIVYLTPDAPLDAGTAFFRHIETGMESTPPGTDKNIVQKMDNDSNNMSKWVMIDRVGNKYNRLVLFRGTRSHRSMTYFGDNKTNGRLFQVFFFNIQE